MLNLQELIDRYKGIDKQYGRSVTGYLAWGGKSFYLINSDEPLSLNCYGSSVNDPDTDGFILNSEKFVEEYHFNNNVPCSNWFKDEDCTVPIGEDDEDYENYFNDRNPDHVIRTYRAPLSSYYPHPWYPERKIKAFEVIRIAPFWTIGKIYDVDEEGLVTSEEFETKMWEGECLNFPEFFKPIYE